MALPRAREARLYYRAGKQRWEDAEILLAAGRRTGAVYLGGYAVECALKALILETMPPGLRRTTLDRFRGAWGHNLQALRDLYGNQSGGQVPHLLAEHFSSLDWWTTDLRYASGIMKAAETNRFMRSAQVVLAWAEGRF